MATFSPYVPIILSLSLSLSFFFSFILPTLINLFNNHNHRHLLHSFLGFSGGLGLITAITLVIVKKPPPPPPPPLSSSSSPPLKTDAPVLDDIGALVVDGLASCTESLGFESFDESRLMEKVENHDEDSCWTKTASEGPGNWKKMSNRVRREVKSFPPPLSSLNPNGQPSFFLRPVRKDGRLELTEVRIHRPKILHVWRHDGRLTLHLIPDESNLDDLEDDVEEEQEQELEQEEEIAETITEEEEEFGFGDWKFGMGGNEGLRRCHEVVNDHRRHVHGSHHHPRHHNHPLHICGVGIA